MTYALTMTRVTWRHCDTQECHSYQNKSLCQWRIQDNCSRRLVWLQIDVYRIKCFVLFQFGNKHCRGLIARLILPPGESLDPLLSHWRTATALRTSEECLRRNSMLANISVLPPPRKCITRRLSVCLSCLSRNFTYMWKLLSGSSWTCY